MPDRLEFLTDIVIAAVEGGTGYWAAASDYDPDRGIVTLREWDEDACDFTGEPHKVTIDTIRHGISVVRQNPTSCAHRLREVILHASADNDAGDIDSEAADVIVQLGLFEELVYG